MSINSIIEYEYDIEINWNLFVEFSWVYRNLHFIFFDASKNILKYVPFHGASLNFTI